jgi:hypothetical protein
VPVTTALARAPARCSASRSTRNGGSSTSRRDAAVLGGPIDNAPAVSCNDSTTRMRLCSSWQFSRRSPTSSPHRNPVNSAVTTSRL